MQDDRVWTAWLDHGEMKVSLPSKLTADDVQYVEDLLALILRTCRRKVEQAGHSTAEVPHQPE